MNNPTPLLCLLALAASLSAASAADNFYPLPAWAIGPFTRPDQAQPVIRPDASSVFDCPINKAPVLWEATHTFNPAAVVRDGKICVLYRAEDDSSKGGVGSYTSRLGLATSEDGIHFVKESKPVLYPDEDSQKGYEWRGGCEDPRLTEGPDGTYYLTYTQYPRGSKPVDRPGMVVGGVRIGLATSRDLHTWTKYGSAFTGTAYEDNHAVQEKSASILNEVKDGRLVAAKVNGKYWMYFGGSFVNIAASADLIHWVPVEGADGKLLTVQRPRSGFADSGLDEIGPNALLTDKGIIVFYNGMNRDPHNGGDPQMSKGVYTGEQALFDRSDPTKLIARLDHPYIQPELAWEKSGQYAEGTTFTEGLALFHGKWFLYYGCADTFVGVAICDPLQPAAMK